MKMSLRWLPGQDSNSESLGTEHQLSREAMQLGKNGVRRLALDQMDGVAAWHAKERNL